MPHLLIAGKLHPAGLATLNAAEGVTYDYVEEVSEASYAPLIGAADALVLRTQPLSAETVAKAWRLKLVSRHGVGYDAVDLAALTAELASNFRSATERAGLRLTIDAPPLPMLTCPLVGALSPAINRSAVDLPQPDGPSSDRNSPLRIVRLIGPSAITPLR